MVVMTVTAPGGGGDEDWRCDENWKWSVINVHGASLEFGAPYGGEGGAKTAIAIASYYD